MADFSVSDPQDRSRICKRLWSPGINSEEPTVCIPPAYAAWQACTTNRFVLPARQAGNRFLGSLKGLQIRAQYFPVDPWISHLKTTLPFFSSLVFPSWGIFLQVSLLWRFVILVGETTGRTNPPPPLQPVINSSFSS